jgi:glycoside/pentoside/hexuronide:cation symporter, GPH family
VLVPPFYAETLGLGVGTVGVIFLIIRLFDAAADPIVGFACDRYRFPRLGRRHTWLMLAAPCVAVSAALVFVPLKPSAFMLLLSGCALSVAWTMYQVPYWAWGAELGNTSHDRTKISAWREGFGVVGVLTALVLPVALSITDPAATLHLFAWGLGIGILVSTLLAVRFVRDAPRVFHPTPLRETVENFTQAVRGNAPFRSLLIAFVLNGFANGLPATLFVFFVTHRLQAPEYVGPFLLIYFISAILGVPLWTYLAAKFSKTIAWNIGIVVACLSFAAAPFLGAGALIGFGVVCVFTGLALGADVVLPPALQADIIAADTATHYVERAGAFLGVWAFASKLALGLSIGIAYPLLGWSGFAPENGIVTPSGLTMLAFLYAGVPVLCKAASMVWIARVER